AVFMICVVSAVDPCQRELVCAVLDNLSKELQYMTRMKYLEELLGSLLFCWVTCGVSLVALVERLFVWMRVCDCGWKERNVVPTKWTEVGKREMSFYHQRVKYTPWWLGHEVLCYLVLDEGDGRCVADLVKEGCQSGWRSCEGGFRGRRMLLEKRRRDRVF
ncbi:hypothetical protein TSUD_134530, partial [Trifolium subterraneum]